MTVGELLKKVTHHKFEIISCKEDYRCYRVDYLSKDIGVKEKDGFTECSSTAFVPDHILKDNVAFISINCETMALVIFIFDKKGKGVENNG